MPQPFPSRAGTGQQEATPSWLGGLHGEQGAAMGSIPSSGWEAGRRSAGRACCGSMHGCGLVSRWQSPPAAPADGSVALGERGVCGRPPSPGDAAVQLRFCIFWLKAVSAAAPPSCSSPERVTRRARCIFHTN